MAYLLSKIRQEDELQDLLQVRLPYDKRKVDHKKYFCQIGQLKIISNQGW